MEAVRFAPPWMHQIPPIRPRQILLHPVEAAPLCRRAPCMRRGGAGAVVFRTEHQREGEEAPRPRRAKESCWKRTPRGVERAERESRVGVFRRGWSSRRRTPTVGSAFKFAARRRRVAKRVFKPSSMRQARRHSSLPPSLHPSTPPFKIKTQKHPPENGEERTKLRFVLRACPAPPSRLCSGRDTVPGRSARALKWMMSCLFACRVDEARL